MPDAPQGSRLIFVGGCPRSGTTLLQNVLDSHPEIFGGPEFDRVPAIVELRNQLRQSVRDKRIDLYVSEHDVDRQIAGLAEHLLLPTADRHGRRLLSEKTPLNVLVFPDLLEIFPGARLVQMVRHPLAVVASMKKVVERAIEKQVPPPETFMHAERMVDLLKRCYLAGFEAARRAPNRVLTVVYERLLVDPAGETRNLCQFLNIEWHAQLLTPAALNRTVERPGVDGVWYDQTMFRRNFDRSRIESWKTELDSELQTEVLNGLAGIPGLAEIGYLSA